MTQPAELTTGEPTAAASVPDGLDVATPADSSPPRPVPTPPVPTPPVPAPPKPGPPMRPRDSGYGPSDTPLVVAGQPDQHQETTAPPPQQGL